MEWYLKVMNQYADFSGRARRKEYWMYTLIYCLVVYSIYFTGIWLMASTSFLMVLMAIVTILGLVHFIPSLAVTVRRLHDTGKSGWWLLIAFIPFIGAIVLLVFLVQDSHPGTNEWGPNPKDPDSIGPIDDTIIDDIV